MIFMSFLSILARRRDGQVHSRDEIQELVRGATNGSIPDYQLAAWLMAAYLRPLSFEETTELTLAMAQSGEVLNLESLPKPWVDKHSTGGVGDKTTLVLLPLLAACGLTVVKMSGRGLGITGGTVDKLSAIPGFRIDLTPEEMIQQAQRIGCALTGQTPRLAPADGVLYALRDATETVRSIPLIAASILSKKIAGGSETILLDVKCGSGAFMSDLTEARQLAETLEQVGLRAGLKVKAEITDMDQPLGRAVGNALEVAEAWNVLSGCESGFFAEACLQMVGDVLAEVGRAPSHEEGVKQARAALQSGAAAERAEAWVVAQGGPAGSVQAPEQHFAAAPAQLDVTTSSEGWVSGWSARVLGEIVRDLGGGRKAKADPIDVSVGLESFIRIGDRVERGQRIARIHAARPEELTAVTARVISALTISSEAVPARPFFLERP